MLPMITLFKWQRVVTARNNFHVIGRWKGYCAIAEVENPRSTAILLQPQVTKIDNRLYFRTSAGVFPNFSLFPLFYISEISSRSMAMTDQEVIETFMSVTGVTEESAIQKLQEHGGDLNEAVNAHFNGDRSPRDPTPTSAQSDFMDIDEPIRRDPPEPILSLFSTDRSFNPFSLLDHSFHPFGGLGDNFNRQAQRVSHPREVREIPIEFKDEPGESSPFAPKIEDVTGNVDVHEGMHGNVTIVNEKEEEALAAPTIVNGSLNESGHSFIDKLPEPSAPHIQSIADYDNDVEEEMLQAAIEASKQEVKRDITYQQIQSNAAEQDKALYKSAEHSRAVDQWDVNLSYGEGTDNQTKGLSQELGSSKLGNSNKLEVEDRYYSFQDEDEINVDEQPLVRNRSRQATSLIGSSYSSKEYYQGVEERPNSVGAHNGDDFHSDEWGGMSSLERDESVMLEAALFGGILGSSGYNFGYNPDRDKQSVSDRNTGSFRQKVLQPPSPALLEQRLIREQQDDEYLAALQVDQEKAIRTLEEAERCRLEEDCARENMLNKRLLNEEIERQLADKQSSLPHEPASNDENAVSLLFRMPDGSRCTRRFLRSDRLQSLFDFIDVGQAVKTGTYRLVRPYPRRAFGGEESHLTLGELGLTGKQEAMFLELI